MLFHSFSLLSKVSLRCGRRTVITAATQEIQEVGETHITDTPSFHIGELCPSKHKSYLNRIYTMPSDVTSLLESIPKELKKQFTIFREFGILIRNPAIEVMSYLEHADYKKPINKYVLYGETGVGKTTTLLHLVHYGLVKQFIVLHLPWVHSWFRFPREVVKSPLEPDKLDLPYHAALWLQYFKRLNKLSLSEFDLQVSKDYTWSQRDVTKCGDSLSNLIEFGIQRSKFACGVIHALVDELKAASTANKCKTLIIIDGFNALTSSYTSVRDEKLVHVGADKFTITSAFYNSVDYNWCNGAAILTVDKRATKHKRDLIYPLYLLSKDGFEHLDPFLPILIEGYSRDELKTILDYYTYRKWIRDISPQGEKELELLSNKNPLDIWHLCKPL